MKGFFGFCNELRREAFSWAVAGVAGLVAWLTTSLLAGHAVGLQYWVLDTGLAWTAVAVLRHWRGQAPQPGGWRELASGLIDVLAGCFHLASMLLGNFARTVVLGGAAALLWWAWNDWEGLRQMLAASTQDEIRQAMEQGFRLAVLLTVFATGLQWALSGPRCTLGDAVIVTDNAREKRL